MMEPGGAGAWGQISGKLRPILTGDDGAKFTKVIRDCHYDGSFAEEIRLGQAGRYPQDTGCACWKNMRSGSAGESTIVLI